MKSLILRKDKVGELIGALSEDPIIPPTRKNELLLRMEEAVKKELALLWLIRYQSQTSHRTRNLNLKFVEHVREPTQN